MEHQGESNFVEIKRADIYFSHQLSPVRSALQSYPKNSNHRSFKYVILPWYRNEVLFGEKATNYTRITCAEWVCSLTSLFVLKIPTGLSLANVRYRASLSASSFVRSSTRFSRSHRNMPSSKCVRTRATSSFALPFKNKR